MAEDSQEVSKPLVYVIDDDLGLLKILERLFLSMKCEVKTFSKPDALFEAIFAQRPALTLVDLNLGDGLSGFEIIKRIRLELKANFPVLILSGERCQQQIAHALELGASDFVCKPPHRAEFERAVSPHLGGALSIPTSFLPIHPDKRRAKLTFYTQIAAVHSVGLTLVSDHLVKKGAHFYIQGMSISRVFPNCEKVFVRVIGNETETTAQQKRYFLHVEIDSSQEQALQDVSTFLEKHARP
jgi:CheY-like chemotaxis protein